MSMRKWSASIAIGVILAVVVVGSMYVRHAADKPSHARVRAEVLAPQLSDAQIAAALRRANVSLDGMSVRNVDGIVLLRGTADTATANKAVAAINDLGFTRVANLVKAEAFDDEGIRRAAERQLAQARSLDGCMLKVSCLHGVIRVSGTIQNELQQDVARNVLRGIEGAHEVQVELKKM
jgi:osmotically-inducible protein OsmY